MNDQNAEENLKGAANLSEIEDKERLDSVGTFLQQVKNLFPILVLKEHFRATHRGLFLTPAFIQPLLAHYQTWLEKQSGGEVHKSEIKCMKRLFGATNPLGMYLNEGKNCLSGFLVPYEMRDPQKLGLPFYLGPLSSKKDYVHASDPLIQSLENVEVLSQSGSVSLRIQVGSNKYSVSSEVFRIFNRLAESSPRMMKDYPDLQESMAVGCKAIAKLIRKSRYASPKIDMLVPLAYSDKNKYSFRIIGSFVFVIDKKFNVVHAYDTRGKSFYYFIRQEFANHKPRNLGSFEIYGDRHRLLGRFVHSGKNYEVRPQAFIDFCNCLSESPDKRDHFNRFFTIKDAFPRFSELFQTAQPIERHKISAYVERYRNNIGGFRINGVWIFVITRDGVIDGCVGKLAIRR